MHSVNSLTGMIVNSEAGFLHRKIMENGPETTGNPTARRNGTLRGHHRQMVDDFLERSFVALHHLGGGGYLALLRLVLAATSS